MLDLMSGFCYNSTIGDVLASTLVMKPNDARQERMSLVNQRTFKIVANDETYALVA